MQQEIGTLIHGTLRTCDLLETFCGYIAEKGDVEQQNRLREILSSYNVGLDINFEDYEDDNPDDASFLLHEEIWPMMEEFAGEGFYFGCTEGDGSDFGFWPTFLSCNGDCKAESSFEYMKTIKEKLVDRSNAKQYRVLTESLNEVCPDCGWSHTQTRFLEKFHMNPFEVERDFTFVDMWFADMVATRFAPDMASSVSYLSSIRDNLDYVSEVTGIKSIKVISLAFKMIEKLIYRFYLIVCKKAQRAQKETYIESSTTHLQKKMLETVMKNMLNNHLG